MARQTQLVIPGLPHHMTQRGNRRRRTFFNKGDYAAYLQRVVDSCREEGVDARYVELNPLRAGLVAVSPDWPRSIAQSHLAAKDDPLVKVAPLLAMIAEGNAFVQPVGQTVLCVTSRWCQAEDCLACAAGSSARRVFGSENCHEATG